MSHYTKKSGEEETQDDLAHLAIVFSLFPMKKF